jgi:hypothetical protein
MQIPVRRALNVMADINTVAQFITNAANVVSLSRGATFNGIVLQATSPAAPLLANEIANGCNPQPDKDLTATTAAPKVTALGDTSAAPEQKLQEVCTPLHTSKCMHVMLQSTTHLNCSQFRIMLYG